MSTPNANEAAAPAPPCVVSPPASSDPNQWFTSEIHPHDGQLKAWLRGQFPNVRDVEDVVQESYLRIWKARALRPIQSAKSFLFTIARHLALDQVRRAKISPLQPMGDAALESVLEDKPSIQDQLSEAEKLRLVAQAIVALPNRMREVVVLHKLEGLSQIETAAKLGISVKTVENTCGRAVVHCRKYLLERGITRFS